jgi:hypothetical protein
MSYYILPKNKNIYILEPKYDDKPCAHFVSHSIKKYYDELYNQINLICGNKNNSSFNSFSELIKIINPYEFIFYKVPGSKFSVSKLKPTSNTFYDFLEIVLTLNIFESYKLQTLNSLHISENNEDTIECNEMLRENFQDNVLFYKKIDDELFKSLNERKFDFMFFDTNSNDLNSYFINLIQYLMLILKCSTENSTTIIKIQHTLHKPVIDILYFLCSLFDKVYIMKPNSNNITTFEKYIICKGFVYNESKYETYKINYYKLLVFLKKLEDRNIVSIIDKELPSYFINKVDDINIIIGQQQLESLGQIVTILKNKNIDDKIESIKKSNIQKSVSWCEKYKIPCNKFTEKTNIFLPIIKENN